MYASQDRREPPTPSDIEGTAEDLRDPIKAYINHLDADLVERSEIRKGWQELMDERDDARREAEERGKMLAALRKVAANLYDNRLGHRPGNPVWHAPKDFWIALSHELPTPTAIHGDGGE